MLSSSLIKPRIPIHLLLNCHCWCYTQTKGKYKLTNFYSYTSPCRCCKSRRTRVRARMRYDPLPDSARRSPETAEGSKHGGRSTLNACQQSSSGCLGDRAPIRSTKFKTWFTHDYCFLVNTCENIVKVKCCYIGIELNILIILLRYLDFNK